MAVLIFLAGNSFHVVKLAAVNCYEMLICLWVCVFMLKIPKQTEHKPVGDVYVSKPGQNQL